MSDGYETEELTRIEAALDALVSPTSEDVFQATRPFDERAIASVAATRGGGGFPAAWTVDPDSGSFVLTYVTPGFANVIPALQITQSGEPLDYTPMFWIGDDDRTLTGTQVLSIDSSGDADWTFRDSGTGLQFRRVHDGENTGLVTIGENGFVIGNTLPFPTGGTLFSATYDNDTVLLGAASSTLGFFRTGGSPRATKQTGVAVTAEAIHAALVAYGLIAA